MNGADSWASLTQNEIKSPIQKKKYIDWQIAVPLSELGTKHYFGTILIFVINYLRNLTASCKQSLPMFSPLKWQIHNCQLGMYDNSIWVVINHEAGRRQSRKNCHLHIASLYFNNVGTSSLFYEVNVTFLWHPQSSAAGATFH